MFKKSLLLSSLSLKLIDLPVLNLKFISSFSAGDKFEINSFQIYLTFQKCIEI